MAKGVDYDKLDIDGYTRKEARVIERLARSAIKNAQGQLWTPKQWLEAERVKDYAEPMVRIFDGARDLLVLLDELNLGFDRPIDPDLDMGL